MPGLTMFFQSLKPLPGNVGDHLRLAKLPGKPLDIRRPFTCQVDFALAQRMNGTGLAIPKQPPETFPQFAPPHETAAPEKSKKSDLAGHARQQSIVDIKEGRGSRVHLHIRHVIKQWMYHVLVVHDVGKSGEPERSDSTGQPVD